MKPRHDGNNTSGECALNFGKALLRSYYSALQSERFTVLVGSDETSFVMPKDLLTMHSLVFKTMCDGSFKEAVDRVIKLPEDDSSVFEAFFAWSHQFRPRLKTHIHPGHKEFKYLALLAVFTETYQILPLKNQVSDIIRFSLAYYQWHPTPTLIETIYSGVPEGSVFRQICYMGFVKFSSEDMSRPLSVSGRYSQENELTSRPSNEDYATVLEQIPDFAIDYFKLTQDGTTKHDNLIAADICTFHDHSDIRDWVAMEKHHKGTEPRNRCPYMHGNALTPFPLQLPLPLSPSTFATTRGTRPSPVREIKRSPIAHYIPPSERRFEPPTGLRRAVMGPADPIGRFCLGSPLGREPPLRPFTGLFGDPNPRYYFDLGKNKDT